MPELPEVETICRGLREHLSGDSSIVEFKIRRADLRVPIDSNLASRLEGQSLRRLRRRAKYLLFDTESITLISHLGMSGSWRTTDLNLRKHDHILIKLRNGTTLIYHDPRRFGLLLWSPLGFEEQNKWLRNLGVEPLSKKFTADYMNLQAKTRSVSIKNFIMDQKIVVGIGNIYASEILYLAGINPSRSAQSLSLKEWGNLVFQSKETLKKAILQKGTTLRDYVQSSGKKGKFKNFLNVYDREGETCRKCKSKIIGFVQNQRSTFWCKKCQI